MKKPKRINSKRPSLWKSKLTKIIRAFYPSGYVEFFVPDHDEWFYSCYSDSEMVIEDLKKVHTFLGYL